MPIPNVVDGTTITAEWGNAVADTANATEDDLTAHLGGHVGIPTGAILPYGAWSAPTGWLLCDGTAVSRTTYAALFAIVGTAFGVGDGSSTFNLPDLRGRFPLGRATTGAGSTLGESGGTLAHSHTGAAHQHTGAGHTHTGPSHAHELPFVGASGVIKRFQTATFGSGASYPGAVSATASSDTSSAAAMLSNTEGTGASGSTTPGNGGSTTPAAGGTATGPYVSLGYIIKS